MPCPAAAPFGIADRRQFSLRCKLFQRPAVRCSVRLQIGRFWFGGKLDEFGLKILKLLWVNINMIQQPTTAQVLGVQQLHLESKRPSSSTSFAVKFLCDSLRAPPVRMLGRDCPVTRLMTTTGVHVSMYIHTEKHMNAHMGMRRNLNVHPCATSHAQGQINM